TGVKPMRNPIRGAAALGMLVLAAGCGAEEGASAVGDAALPQPAAEAGAALAPRVLAVTAGDFFFRAPSTTPAGLTTIRLVNQGPDLHHVQLIRLDEGHTMRELLDAVSAGGQVPEWAREVGGPNTPAPGEQTETTLDLRPGDYAMVCVIPAPDGVPHFMKGMVVPLTVTPAADGVAAPEPAADVRMTLTDYAFEFDEIAAGKRVIRVENRAAQAHEVLLVQLALERTLEQLVSWLAKPSGPPP